VTTTLLRDAAEADLVAVRVAIDRLARPFEYVTRSSGSIPREAISAASASRSSTRIVIIASPGRFAVLLDEQVAMRSELPDGLSGMRDERGRPAQQALVPGPRGVVVADADPGEEAQSHRSSIRVDVSDLSPAAGVIGPLGQYGDAA
jgi:hypothetical protein